VYTLSFRNPAAIDDTSATHIAKLRGLFQLDLCGTQVTPQGLKELSHSSTLQLVFYDEASFCLTQDEFRSISPSIVFAPIACSMNSNRPSLPTR
jgi:hypothetical protein